MKKEEKIKNLNKKSIWYRSGCNWLEIKDLEYGINDYVIYTINNRYNRKNLKVKRSIIRYNKKGDPFFICDGYTVKFNDIIRMD